MGCYDSTGCTECAEYVLNMCCLLTLYSGARCVLCECVCVLFVLCMLRTVCCVLCAVCCVLYDVCAICASMSTQKGFVFVGVC